MKISELIRHLEAIREKEGDLRVMTQTLFHTFDAELPVVKGLSEVASTHNPKWVLLNP